MKNIENVGFNPDSGSDPEDLNPTTQTPTVDFLALAPTADLLLRQTTAFGENVRLRVRKM